MHRALALVAVVVLAGCVHELPTSQRPPAPSPVDADRLLALVREQVEHPNGTIRYRIPGTPGNAEVAEWIRETLAEDGIAASFHNFTAAYRCQGEMAMRNVVAKVPGRTNETIYLAAHFDTRPVADKDPDPSKRTQPVPGANDGASGVAVVLELARLLAQAERRQTFVLLFFDGEDGGQDARAPACNGAWILGSRAHAAALSAEDVREARAFLLFDLVGDRELAMQREGYTAIGAGKAVQDRLWAIGAGRGHGAIFRDVTGPAILDDHKPYLDRGIPAVDLLHLDGGADPFPSTHHTTSDDLAHVSKESLAAVTATAWAWIEETERG